MLDYQALWFMQRVIEELKEVCFNYGSSIPYNQSLLTQVWWSSFVLKNSRRQMEDYIAVVPYLHTLFDVKVCDVLLLLRSLWLIFFLLPPYIL